MKRYLPLLGWAIWLATLVPIMILAFALLFSAITARGVLFAIAVILIWSGVPFFRSKTRLRAIVGMSLLAIGSVIWICLGSFGAAKRSDPNANFRSVFDGRAGFRKRSVSRIVPESDQLLTGARLFAYIDPYFDHQQSRSLRKHIKTIYREMSKDPDYGEIGSELGQCYKQIFTGRADSGHRYQYFPDGVEGKIPAVLFLHGSLGNFKGYQWVLKQFADNNGVAIISPSFGYGEWRNESGRMEIRRGLDLCLSHPDIDPKRIYLAGISNGGAGMTMILPEAAEQIAGAIFLSPVLENEKVSQPEFLAAIKDKPILLISGTEDRRIPASKLREGVAMIGKVTSIEAHFIEAEDHFLFFSKRDLICDLLSEWFEKRR